MVKRMCRLLLIPAIFIALAVGGLLIGSSYRVMTAGQWERFSGPEGEWVALFPVHPVLRAGEAPLPFTGSLQTWAASTPTGSYEVAVLDTQPVKERMDGPRPVPMLLAADAANVVNGTLELTDGPGFFKITTAEKSIIYGRVLEDRQGRIIRLLAASSSQNGNLPGGPVALFLDEFRLRGERKQ